MPEGSRFRQWGKVEYNPARILEPDGWGLCSLGEALLTVGPALTAARQLVSPVWDDPELYSVKRVDVAKDFESVDDPSMLIRSLGSLPRRWSRLNMTHADPKRNGSQTLFVGSGAGGVRLYNKHDETSGEAPEGTVRWETEARKGWLMNYGGIRQLGELNEESVETLARDRWEWSQMGAEVASSTSRLVQLVNQSDLSASQRLLFLGWLVEQSAGIDSSSLSKNTLSKYRRLQRQLGIAAPVDFGSMIEVVRRLDWETGKELVSVRAA
jgi:hypothetical protein